MRPARSERAAAYEPKAINFLVRAGDRARGLDTAAATSRYEAALALTPPGHPQRPEILLRFGSVAYHQLRFEEAIAALDEAIDAWSGEDDWQLRGRAMVQRLLAQLETGDLDFGRRWAMTGAVLELLESHEPTPELVEALTERGIDLINDSRPQEALDVFDRALEAASSLGMRVPGRTLGFRGETRLYLGDAHGMDDLRASREIAREVGRGRDLVIATVNTGNWEAHYEGAQPAIETVLEAIALAERFGYGPLANAMRLMSCQFLIDAGRLDEADEMLVAARSRQAEPVPTTAEHRIQALRGQEAEALAGVARIEQEVLPQAGIDDERVVIRTRMMEIRACFGRHEDALRDLEAVLAIERRAETDSYVGQALPTLIRAACNAGRIDLAEQILEEAARAPFPYSVHAHVAARALIAEQQGRLEDAVEGFHDAADRWASFYHPDRGGTCPDRPRPLPDRAWPSRRGRGAPCLGSRNL